MKIFTSTPSLWKKLAYFFTLLFCLFVLIFNFYAANNIIPWEFPKDSHKHHFIAHGGGSINELTYTDSKEAVLNSIDNGFRLIELDLIETSDGQLVAAHDWSHFKKITNRQGAHDNSPLSYSEYINSRIHGGLSPVSLQEINNIFMENKDLYLVIDKSNNFKKINESLFFHDRFFVEIFGLKNYIFAVFNNIKRPVFSLTIGKLGPWWEYFKLRLFNMRYVAVDKDTYFNNSSFFNKLREVDIKVFVFTLNTSTEIRSAIKMHDTTVYTDIENINNFE